VSNEFGRTLHAWRDRTTPAAAGLPPGGHRRAPGLRREELGQLAGLSVDYVVRLEQGKATNPSPQVVAALARALRLTTAERDHLYVLAGHTPPNQQLVSTHIPRGVQRLLDQLAGAPLSVYDACWNLVTWNRLWAALLGDPSELRGRDRNAAWWAFVGLPAPGHRVTTSDEVTRRFLVSDLRAASVRYPADREVHALVADLRGASGEFASLWDSGAVGVIEPQTKTVHHPAVGPVTLDCDVLTALGTDLRIIAFTAEAGSEAAERLRLLDVVGTQV
jgi:transcriptional regulator with XRE-family HTH domain